MEGQSYSLFFIKGKSLFDAKFQGTQQKSIEDDPSITPGSVARSPLSIAAKDSDLFSGASKTSPEIQPISLSNSTWSFTPSGQQSFSR